MIIVKKISETEWTIHSAYPNGYIEPPWGNNLINNKLLKEGIVYDLSARDFTWNEKKDGLLFPISRINLLKMLKAIYYK